MNDHIDYLTTRINEAAKQLSVSSRTEIEKMTIIVELTKNITSKAQAVSVMRGIIKLDAVRPTNEG